MAATVSQPGRQGRLRAMQATGSTSLIYFICFTPGFASPVHGQTFAAAQPKQQNTKHSMACTTKPEPNGICPHPRASAFFGICAASTGEQREQFEKY